MVKGVEFSSGKDVQTRISLTFFEHSSERIKKSPHATVFLPGWSMRGDSPAIKIIGQELCNVNPNDRVFSLATTPLSPDTTFRDEADTMRNFLRLQGITHATLVGYSEGATKAITLAAQLQHDPEMRLKGVILCSPLGLAEAKNLTGRLLSAMFFHIPVNTLGEIIRDPHEWKAFFYALRAGIGVFKGIGEEVLDQRGRYFSQLRRDISEMRKSNPLVDSVVAPIVVIAGAKDSVVKRRQITDAVIRLKGDGLSINIVSSDKLSNHGLPFIQPRRFIRDSRESLDQLNLIP